MAQTLKPQDPLNQLAADFAKKGVDTKTMMRRLFDVSHAVPAEINSDSQKRKIRDKAVVAEAKIAQPRAEIKGIFSDEPRPFTELNNTTLEAKKNIDALKESDRLMAETALLGEFQNLEDETLVLREERKKLEKEADEVKAEQAEKMPDLFEKLSENKVTNNAAKEQISLIDFKAKKLETNTVKFVKDKDELQEEARSLESKSKLSVSAAKNDLSGPSQGPSYNPQKS